MSYRTEISDGTVLKVAALVFRHGPDGSELLVFDHPLSEGGSMVQVPAGTIEPEEEPEVAVVRELFEETGVSAKIDGLAGVLDEEYENERRRRWIYVMSPVGDVKERWPYRCDCGLPTVCRWEAVGSAVLHELQMPWLHIGRDWISRNIG